MSLRGRIKRERARLVELRGNIAGRSRGLKAVNARIATLKARRDALPNPSPERAHVRKQLKHKRAVRRAILFARARHQRKANIVARRLRHDRKVVAIRKRTREAAKAAGPQHGLVWFDGHKGAAWVVHDLKLARLRGAWHGIAVSLWRDPVYSESLCYRICGRPFCSGLCAGRGSRHVGIEYPNGAADVTDYVSLLHEVNAHRAIYRIRGGQLPRDPVHFSADGH